jgi:hypothetical protein
LADSNVTGNAFKQLQNQYDTQFQTIGNYISGANYNGVIYYPSTPEIAPSFKISRQTNTPFRRKILLPR